LIELTGSGHGIQGGQELSDRVRQFFELHLRRETRAWGQPQITFLMILQNQIDDNRHRLWVSPPVSYLIVGVPTSFLTAQANALRLILFDRLVLNPLDAHGSQSLPIPALKICRIST